MASSSRVRIAFRAAGSSDPWSILRRTNDALTLGSESQRSDEVRDDRMRSGQVTTTVTAGGSVDIEFSAVSFDALLSAAMHNSWNDDVLGVGTEDIRFDILKSYLDTGDHFLLEDCVVSELSLTMNAGEKVTGQIVFMGESFDDDYDPSGDTFDPAEETLIMDSSNNLGSIMQNGAPISGMCYTALSININNGYQSDQCVGELNQRHWVGSADITGNKAIRLSAAALELWRNSITNAPVSSAWTLSDGDYSYEFSLPRIQLSGNLPAGGLDQILTVDMQYVASVEDDEMLTITRTVPTP